MFKIHWLSLAPVGNRASVEKGNSDLGHLERALSWEVLESTQGLRHTQFTRGHHSWNPRKSPTPAHLSLCDCVCAVVFSCTCAWSFSVQLSPPLESHPYLLEPEMHPLVNVDSTLSSSSPQTSHTVFPSPCFMLCKHRGKFPAHEVRARMEFNRIRDALGYGLAQERRSVNAYSVNRS